MAWIPASVLPMSRIPRFMSRMPLASSWGERMAASGSGTGAEAAAGPDAAGLSSMAAVTPTVVVGAPEDIVTEVSDTKLVEPGDLPERDRRL